jgi:hypothetical protein
MKLILSMSLMIFLITQLFAQDEEIKDSKLNNVEEEIWSLEENYISYFSKADHNAILSLYHSQFLGWPDSELHPASKERAAIFLEEKYPEPIQLVFKIKTEGIRIVEGVVITHYLLNSFWIDDEGVEQTREGRLTHTWIEEDSHWRILGGMSSK